MVTELTDPRLAAFAKELRKWWSFDDCQGHTHSWHTREDFIEKKLPKLLEMYAAQRLESLSQVTEEEVEAGCEGFRKVAAAPFEERADLPLSAYIKAALEAARKART